MHMHRLAMVVALAAMVTPPARAQLARGADYDGPVNTRTLNGIRFAHRFPGANAAAKVAACLADLPSSGGTCDARGLEGRQAWSSDPFKDVRAPADLWLPAGTTELSVSFSVPANITLHFDRAASLSLGRGVTLTILGPIVAPPARLFSGEGKVSFAGNAVLDFAYPQWWGAAGDDSSDSTAALQAAESALDTAGRGELRFPQGIYRISAPLLKKPSIRWSGFRAMVTIKKTTNTVGNGTRRYAKGAVDDYAVDAILSVDHPDNQPARYVAIEGLVLQGSAPSPNAYGIFAPRLASPTLRDMSIRNTRTAFFTHQSYLGTFEQIESVGTGTGFQWDPDSAHNSTGTSMHLIDVSCNTATVRCFDIFGLTYSDFASVAADNVTGTAYYFSNSRGIAINGAGAENVTSTVLEVENSNIAINGLLAYNVKGQADNSRAVIKLTSSARVTLDNCHFPAINAPGSINNVLVASGSQLYARNTQLPSGGSAFLALSPSSLLVVEDGNGKTVQWSDGANVRRGSIIDGHKIMYATAPPASGSFSAGDMVLNSAPAAGQPWAWVCTSAGSPGAWAVVAVVGAPAVPRADSRSPSSPDAGRSGPGTGQR